MAKKYIIITSTFPSHKTAELMERSREVVKKYPHDANGFTLIAHVMTRAECGYKTISIVEAPEGKLADLYDHSEARQRMYNDIEGYESTIEICTQL